MPEDKKKKPGDRWWYNHALAKISIIHAFNFNVRVDQVRYIVLYASFSGHSFHAYIYIKESLLV